MSHVTILFSFLLSSHHKREDEKKVESFFNRVCFCFDFLMINIIDSGLIDDDFHLRQLFQFQRLVNK